MSQYYDESDGSDTPSNVHQSSQQIVSSGKPAQVAPQKQTIVSSSKTTVTHKGLGKGKGKNGAKRHNRIQRDNLRRISSNDLRRLARRGGVKRIAHSSYDDLRLQLKSFLTTVIRSSITYTDHAKRKTVTPLDIVYALKQQGRQLYGFGHA